MTTLDELIERELARRFLVRRRQKIVDLTEARADAAAWRRLEERKRERRAATSR